MIEYTYAKNKAICISNVSDERGIKYKIHNVNYMKDIFSNSLKLYFNVNNISKNRIVSILNLSTNSNNIKILINNNRVIKSNKWFERFLIEINPGINTFEINLSNDNLKGISIIISDASMQITNKSHIKDNMFDLSLEYFDFKKNVFNATTKKVFYDFITNDFVNVEKVRQIQIYGEIFNFKSHCFEKKFIKVLPMKCSSSFIFLKENMKKYSILLFEYKRNQKNFHKNFNRSKNLGMDILINNEFDDYLNEIMKSVSTLPIKNSFMQDYYEYIINLDNSLYKYGEIKKYISYYNQICNGICIDLENFVLQRFYTSKLDNRKYTYFTLNFGKSYCKDTLVIFCNLGNNCECLYNILGNYKKSFFPNCLFISISLRGMCFGKNISEYTLFETIIDVQKTYSFKKIQLVGYSANATAVLNILNKYSNIFANVLAFSGSLSSKDLSKKALKDSIFVYCKNDNNAENYTKRNAIKNKLNVYITKNYSHISISNLLSNYMFLKKMIFKKTKKSFDFSKLNDLLILKNDEVKISTIYGYPLTIYSTSDCLNIAEKFKSPKTFGVDPYIDINFPVLDLKQFNLNTDTNSIIIFNSSNANEKININKYFGLDKYGIYNRKSEYNIKYSLLCIESINNKLILFIVANDNNLFNKNIYTRISRIICVNIKNLAYNNVAIIYMNEKYYCIKKWGLKLTLLKM